MSNFLANLVRRGVGLAPTVGSRPAAAAADVDGASSESEGVDVDAPLDAAAPHSAPIASQPVTPVASAPGPRDVPAPTLLSRPIAETAAPLVQRIVMPAPSAPATAPVVQRIMMPAAPAPPAASVGPIHSIARSSLAATPLRAESTGAGDEPPLWRPPLTSSIEPGAPSIGTHAAVNAPAASHDSSEGLRPSAPITPELRGIDRVITHTRIIEPTRDAGRSAIAEPSPLPAPLAAPPEPPAPDTMVMPERVVHVRIGAIEIHGAPPPLAAPPAAPSQPAAVQPSSDGGFDRYARLRSYAPREW